MNRHLFAVVLVLALAAVPAFSQRGGGARGGGSGGHPSAGFRGGFSSAPRASFASAPRMSFAPAARVGFPQPAGRFSSNSSARRPVYGGYGRYRRPYAGLYGLVLPPAVTWFGPGYYNPDFYGDDDYGDNSTASVAPPVPDVYPPEADEQMPPPPNTAEAPAPLYRQPYVSPQAAEDVPAPTPVTLVFNDGRPPEEIHNYVLTHNTLYVEDDHVREIPLSDLDLVETRKINQYVGIDFAVPDGR